MKSVSDIDEGTIRKIDWQELLPVTLLIRSFSLTLCFLIVGAISFGFSVFISLFNFTGIWLEQYHGLHLDELKFSTVLEMYINYFNQMEYSWLGTFSIVVFIAVILFIWLMLARSTAVRIASSGRSGFCESFMFACTKYRSLLGTLVIYGIVTGIPWFLYYILSFTTSNGWISGVTIPIQMILAFVFMFMILTFMCSFPMMISAIATEKSDCFDAFARGFSYLLQRPLHYIFYAVCSILLTFIGFCLAFIAVLAVYKQNQFLPVTNIGTAFWLQTLFLIPFGYLFVCKIIYSTSIYFLLRRSVDGTPIDQFKSKDSHKPTRKLVPFFYDEKNSEPLKDESNKETNS